MADKPLTACPECLRNKKGRGSVKRKMSGGAGLIFKGSGFYITDYRSEGYKQAAKKESDSAKPTASTDSKPAATAAKSDSKPAKAKAKD